MTCGSARRCGLTSQERSLSDRDDVIARAPARAALAGNPSDAYGGAVLALAFDNISASARVGPSPTLRVTPDAALVRAAVVRLQTATGTSLSETEIRWETTIPRSVGLAGSSAIVISVLRALCGRHAIGLLPADLAQLALEVETEELGIAAGLQDRVAQAYGGLTFMDFATPHRYESLDPSLLPPLVVAWQTEHGEESGIVHGDLRERYDRGEPIVHEAMGELRRLAHAARTAVLAGDIDGLARCADGSFDARARVLTLDPRHTAMISVARAAGAGANYAGSGGAIACVCRDDAHQRVLIDALTRAGAHAIVPRITPGQ